MERKKWRDVGRPLSVKRVVVVCVCVGHTHKVDLSPLILTLLQGSRLGGNGSMVVGNVVVGFVK